MPDQKPETLPSITQTRLSDGTLVPADLAARLRLAEAQLAMLPSREEDKDYAATRQWCEEIIVLISRVSHAQAQLQGATANEQSVVNEEAHDRDELALVVQQKDALSVANHTLRKALHIAQSELDYWYQTLCSSVCPPCKQGECYDYSELRPPERAEIDRVEAALDAVDVALAETEDK